MNKARMKKKLENFGYVFKGERILAGFSKRVKNFSCVGKHFHCNWDDKEKVVGHFYTPVTPDEARTLSGVLDPVTGEPYVGIAWVVMPWEQFEQKEVAALKVVEAAEYKATPQEALEYADDFEDVVAERKAEKLAANKAAAGQAVTDPDPAPAPDPAKNEEDLTTAPNAEQVDADLDTLPAPTNEAEDPLADMVSDANGVAPKQDMSLERAELDSKSVPELQKDAKELGLKGFHKLRKDELIEAILG